MKANKLLTKLFQKAARSKTAISFDSRRYYERVSTRRPRTLDERLIDRAEVIAPPTYTVTEADSDKMEEGNELPFAHITDMTGREKNSCKIKTSFLSSELSTSMMRRVSTQQHRRHKGSESQADEEEEEFEVLEEDESGANVDEEQASSPLAEMPSGPDLSSPTVEEPPEMPTEEQDKQEKIKEKNKEKPMASGDRPDNQTLLRLLEEGEELQSMFRCARIQVKRFLNGFTAKKIFFRASNQPKVCCCSATLISTLSTVILS